MELSLGNVLKCPSGTPGVEDRTIEMAELYRLEARKQEIATVNKANAAELMQAFIDGFGLAARAVVQLDWELTQATKFAEERKAVVYLEVAPAFLQEKGLVRAANPSGSEDQRKAVLARDKEYLSLQDRVSMIEASAAYLKLKMKGFEMSYQAVKRVYDNLSNTNAVAYGVSKPAGATEYVGDVERNTFVDPTKITIGKPRY